MAKQFYKVALCKPDKSKQYHGKAATEADARTAARARATADGEDPDLLVEKVYNIVGPDPRTFEGNEP